MERTDPAPAHREWTITQTNEVTAGRVDVEVRDDLAVRGSEQRPEQPCKGTEAGRDGRMPEKECLQVLGCAQPW